MKEMRNKQQQKRRDMRLVAQEEIKDFVNTQLTPKYKKLQTTVNSKIKNIQKKVKSATDTLACVSELEQQIDNLHQEVTDKFDGQQVRAPCPDSPTPTHLPSYTNPHPQVRHDRLLKELETKLTESVREIGVKLKKSTTSLVKKCKKISTDLSKVTKDMDLLGDRWAKMQQTKQTAKRKRRRREVKPEPKVQTGAVQRPPTPMVPRPQPQHASMSGPSWWNVNDSVPQAFVGSNVATRRVSPTPTPHFISPVYASRNYIR